MAEKNTLSILETIKKKMTKLDQKTEKDGNISDVSDEFEYITPARGKAGTQAVQEKAESKMPDIIAEEKSKPRLDDFNLYDLDLDDENSFAKTVKPASPDVTQAIIKPAPDSAETPQTIQTVGENFNEEDVEDYEDEVEFKENEKIEEEPVEPLSPSFPAPEEKENDLNFEDQSEKNFEAQIEEEGEELSEEHEYKEEYKEETAEDTLTVEENNEKKEEPVAEASAIAPILDEDLNFDDLEKDEKTEALLFPPQKNEEVAPVEIHDDQDELNLDHLDFDELSHEEEKPVEEPKQSVSENVESGESLSDEELLKKLEQEAEEKRNQPKKDISLTEEIELEFEKEIMGFKPKQDAEASQDQTPQSLETPQPQNDKNFFEQDIPKNSQTEQPAADDSASSKKESLIGEPAAAQASDAIKRLIDAQNVVSGIAQFSQSSAFSELATQLMEPKLEKWLNENLPQMVEKIVREEIKKLIPKE